MFSVLISLRSLVQGSSIQVFWESVNIPFGIFSNSHLCYLHGLARLYRIHINTVKLKRSNYFTVFKGSHTNMWKLIILPMSWEVTVNSCQKFYKDTKKKKTPICQTHLVKNAFKEESKVFESPERNLIWTDDEVQLLLKTVRNSKTQKVCGSTTLFDPTTPCVFLKHISLFLRQMQNYFSVLPKLRTSLTYVIALRKVQSKKLSFKNHKCTY